MGEGTYITKKSFKGFRSEKKGGIRLVSLDMELTERCNNNCIHCYINRPLHDDATHAQELSTGDVQSILEAAASLGCITVRFTGGEPFVRDDFPDIYVFGRRLGLRVGIFTNATLITRELADLFARIPPLEKIEISMYGMNREQYEGVTRNSGSFLDAQRGLELLRKRNIPFMIKRVIVPPTAEGFDKFESESGMTDVTGEQLPPPLFLNLRCRRDSEEKNKKISSLRCTPEEVVNILSRRHDEYVLSVRNLLTPRVVTVSDNLFTCDAGLNSGCVDAYGLFQPCMLLRHPDTVYDLKRGSLKEALTTFFPVLRQTQPVNQDYQKRCSRCFLKNLCEQCPARSWIEHGTLDTPVEYFCHVTHAQARYLGLIGATERAWEVPDYRKRVQTFLSAYEGIRSVRRKTCE